MRYVRRPPMQVLMIAGLVATSISLAFWLTFLFRTPMDKTSRDAEKVVPKTERQRVVESYGKLPLYFIENRGQIDGAVAYYLQGRNTAVYFTPGGVTFALTEARDRRDAPDAPRFRPASFDPDTLETPSRASTGSRRWTVTLEFVGANPGVRPRGVDATPAVVSYFKGPREQWHTGLTTYASVIYSELWPGIDLLYSGVSSRMKYTFLVKPGADPNQIRLAYRGADVSLTGVGELEISTPLGGFREAKPYSYQEGSGERRTEVPTSYVVERAVGNGSSATAFGFRVGPYDTNRPLILDPVVLIYAGYIGGLGEDEEGRSVAVDGAGHAYVTGRTFSTEASFPVTEGPDLTHNGCCDDAFVAKVAADGTALVYAGYIGGTDSDWGRGIAVDGTGHAYVTGLTASTEASFPVSGGPDLTFNGLIDAFVAKVAADGTGLVYAGYIGGTGNDQGFSIAVDGAGYAYVTGSANSTEASFPVTVGPDVTFNGPLPFGNDAFVAKVAADGTGLVYAGYIGGTGSDAGNSIAVDDAGHAYVAGETQSTEASFPVAGGPDLTFNGGAWDAFVAKVAADGAGLVYAGYIGGTGFDQGFGVAVDGADYAYVTGHTSSTETNFPVTVGPDVTFNGGFDAFVAKVAPDGTGLIYAGYIGGTGGFFDLGNGIAVDDAGHAYVTGRTDSDEVSFPVAGGPDLTFNGDTDAFIAKVAVDGTGLVYAGYIGGTRVDEGFGVAVDDAGNAYVTGGTESESTVTGFPVTVGPDLTFNGSQDAFVAKIGADGDGGGDEVVVTIDIKPGSFPNSINPGAGGVIPVAILTTADFDASSVAPSSVEFGPAGATVVHTASHLEDGDGDGDLDLVLHFRTAATGIACGDDTASLTGETFEGQPIVGSDSVRAVPCK